MLLYSEEECYMSECYNMTVLLTENYQKDPEIWIAPTGSYPGSGTPDWNKFTMCGKYTYGYLGTVQDILCGMVSYVLFTADYVCIISSK